MRTILVFVLLFLSGCLLAAPLKKPPKYIQLTVYEDGTSCPGKCEAHVVFDKRLNGTDYAHLPGTQVDECRPEENCEICIEEGRKQCLVVKYMKAGPPEYRFDFTPAFYEKACASTPPQKELAKACVGMKREGDILARRVSCIATPDNPKCTRIMAEARKSKEIDQPKYRLCLKLGEKIYNADRPVDEQRIHTCTYEAKSAGLNSKNQPWHKLLPASCKAGTYVGPTGEDCCTGLPYKDASFGVGCHAFYPKP